MRHRVPTCLAALTAALAALALSGCSNPDAAPPGGGEGAREPGLPAAPPAAAGAAPADVQRTPEAAILQYARLWVNWTSASLAARQMRLAAISVGAARLTDRQDAAQARRDGALASSGVRNEGQVVSVSRDRGAAGTWVLVTRERTSGGREYEGLPARYHVTLARLRRERHGWAVSEWLPQS